MSKSKNTPGLTLWELAQNEIARCAVACANAEIEVVASGRDHQRAQEAAQKAQERERASHVALQSARMDLQHAHRKLHESKGV